MKRFIFLFFVLVGCASNGQETIYYSGPDRLTKDDAETYCQNTGGRLAIISGPDSLQGIYETCLDAQDNLNPSACHVATTIQSQTGIRWYIVSRNGSLISIEPTVFNAFPVCEVRVN